MHQLMPAIRRGALICCQNSGGSVFVSVVFIVVSDCGGMLHRMQVVGGIQNRRQHEAQNQPNSQKGIYGLFPELSE